MRSDLGLTLLASIMVTVQSLGGPVQVKLSSFRFCFYSNLIFKVDVENLTEDQRKVVDFALDNLSGGEVCRSNLVRVENFSQQLVAGFR